MKRIDAEKLEALAKMFESPNAIPAGEYTRGYNNGLSVASEAIRALIADAVEEPGSVLPVLNTWYAGDLDGNDRVILASDYDRLRLATAPTPPAVLDAALAAHPREEKSNE